MDRLRSWLFVLGMALAVGATVDAGAQVIGSAQLAGNVLFAVRGCGRSTGSLAVNAYAAAGGFWTAQTSEGRTLSGTLAAAGPGGRTLALQFDAPSQTAFVTDLTAEATTLCGTTVTVASVVQKRFDLRVNRRQTRAKLAVLYAFTGAAGGREGTARYRLKAVGSWLSGG